MLTRIYFSSFASLFLAVDGFFFSFCSSSALFGWLFLLLHFHLRRCCCRLFIYFHLSVSIHVPALNHTFFDKFIARTDEYMCPMMTGSIGESDIKKMTTNERYYAMNAVICSVCSSTWYGLCFLFDNTHTHKEKVEPILLASFSRRPSHSLAL